MMLRALLCYLLVVNLVAFGAYGVDKRRARRHKWRIPEATLLGVAFVGGSVGALLGMRVFHHKTRKWKFRLGVPAAAVLWVAGGIFCYIKLF